MKKTLLVIAMLACSSVSFAGSNQKQGTSTNSTANSVAAAQNAGNTQAITFTAPADTSQTINSTNATTIGGTTTSNVNYSGSQTIRNVPSVNGPPLVSSNDTCMGSASGSVNAPGFGLSVGKTYTDGNCVMLKNSRELWNMGMKGAAMARMCMDSDNKEALELTGFVCPTRKQGAKTASVESTQEYTDPIIRARLGLSPLATTK